MIKMLGVEMLNQAEVAIEIEKATGEKMSKGAVCEWLARAGLEGIPFKRTKHYSVDLIRDYLRYEKMDLRVALEILREIRRQKIADKK